MSEPLQLSAPGTLNLCSSAHQTCTHTDKRPTGAVNLWTLQGLELSDCGALNPWSSDPFRIQPLQVCTAGVMSLWGSVRPVHPWSFGALELWNSDPLDLPNAGLELTQCGDQNPWVTDLQGLNAQGFRTPRIKSSTV